MAAAEEAGNTGSALHLALRKAEPKRLRATRVNNVLSVVIVVHMAMFLILDITRAHALY